MKFLAILLFLFAIYGLIDGVRTLKKGYSDDFMFSEPALFLGYLGIKQINVDGKKKSVSQRLTGVSAMMWGVLKIIFGIAFVGIGYFLLTSNY